MDDDKIWELRRRLIMTSGKVFDKDGHEVSIVLPCSECREYKPLSEFGVEKTRSHQLVNHMNCRRCRSAYRASRRRKHAAHAHEQVEVDYRGQRICVDAGMRDLLRAAWDLGIATDFSCQGGQRNREQAYILFPEAESATAFAAHLLPNLPDATRSAAAGDTYHFRRIGSKDYPDNNASNTWAWNMHPSPSGATRFTVRFPHQLVGAVADALRASRRSSRPPAA
jgi:hypothetical protein